MPQYRYTALAHNGTLVAGESTSVSVDALRAELEGLGLRAQTIRIKHDFVKFWRRSAVRPEEFLLFVQELMALVRAGLPLPEGLALAADRPAAPVLSQGGPAGKFQNQIQMSATLAYLEDDLQVPRRRHLHLVAVDGHIVNCADGSAALGEVCGLRSSTKPLVFSESDGAWRTDLFGVALTGC